MLFKVAQSNISFETNPMDKSFSGKYETNR